MAETLMLGFLGCGKMATALARGFLRSHLVSPAHLIGSDLQRLTVSENLAFFAAAYGLRDWRPVAEELLRRFRFEVQAQALVATVSGGTRQKLNLVLALLHDPDVLLLDEPYSGLDWETYQQFWSHARELRERGKALLVVSHLVHDRERYDRVLDLRGGRLQ